MKKALFLLMAVFFCSIPSLNAQENVSHQDKNHECMHQKTPYSAETRAMMHTDKIAATVNLTEKEKKEVLELYKKIEAEKDANKANMEKQRAENEAALEKIIGAERMQVLKEKRMKENARTTRPVDKNHRPGKPAPAPHSMNYPAKGK